MCLTIVRFDLICIKIEPVGISIYELIVMLFNLFVILILFKNEH